MSDATPSRDPVTVVITGGKGDLAGQIEATFRSDGCRVFAPGRGELDVSSSASVTDYFSRFDRVDVLINNAGVTRDHLFARLTEEAWEETLSVNLKGAHLCSQAAARIQAKHRAGQIINIGSYSALRPPPGQSAYAAAKAGLIALTKSYAREFGMRNLRVNCVLPGFLETKMTCGLSETARETALARHELGQFNTPVEAARFIHFLATTSFISGQVFQLDSRV